MTDGGEWQPWLRDAEAALDSARRDWAARAWRDTCLFAQLAIEMSAKAVIASFAQPQWTHDPGEQIRRIVLARSDAELESLFGGPCREALERLARDARETAPWHTLAVYGKKLPGRARVAAVDVCTQEAAQDLLARAEHAVALASRLRRPTIS